MGLYDEVSVAEGNKVNIPQPKESYQTNSLKCTLSDIHIDKEGYIHYVVDKEYLINTLALELYGEDHTGYYRKYELVIAANQIISVHEIDDDKNYNCIYITPAVNEAAKRMADNMIPAYQRLTMSRSTTTLYPPKDKK